MRAKGSDGSELTGTAEELKSSLFYSRAEKHLGTHKTSTLQEDGLQSLKTTSGSSPDRQELESETMSTDSLTVEDWEHGFMKRSIRLLVV